MPQAFCGDRLAHFLHLRGKMFIIGFGLAVTVLVVLPTPAHAYLDPGTGSMLLQGLIAAIAGGLATVKIFWMQIVSVLQRIAGRGPKGSGTHL